MSAKLKVVPSNPDPVVLLVEQPNLMWEFRGKTFEEHLICWQEIASEVERDSWMLGAIAASLVTKYNDATIDRFAHEVRLSGRRVREIAQTYRAFQNGERSPILSFHHHTIAARGKDKGIDPIDAIHKAEDKEWSTRELDVFVKTGIEPIRTPRKNSSKVALPPQLQKLHDRAVREHLDAAIVAIRQQSETPPDPLLGSVYRRVIEIMEWQRDRSIEGDCLAIAKIFASEEGSESPETVSEDYITAWLNGHGFIMGDAEIGEAGCPKNCPVKHEHVEGSGRIGIMVRLKFLRVESREGSRGETQRGSIPGVLSFDPGYFEDLDRISRNPRAPERQIAAHKDWIERAKRYAPELLPKEEEAAA